MFYAALDVSLRAVAICIIDHEGKVRLERSVPSDVLDLVRCLREFGEPIPQGRLGGRHVDPASHLRAGRGRL